MARIIGKRRFTDGVERDVFEEPDGQQYVVAPVGEPVYGVWILSADGGPVRPSPSLWCLTSPRAVTCLLRTAQQWLRLV